MTADLTPEALDALVASLRDEMRGECHDAADTITTLRAEIEALKAAIFGSSNYDPTLPIGCFREMALTTEAARVGALERATAAEAALAAAMVGAVRVDSFKLRNNIAELMEDYFEWREKADTGDGFCLIEAERRILAALEPNPAAQDREALIAATLGEPAAWLFTRNGDDPVARTKQPNALDAHMGWKADPLYLATQPQTDALAARLQTAARLCDLSPQEIAEGDWGPEGLAMAQMLKLRILNLI